MCQYNFVFVASLLYIFICFDFILIWSYFRLFIPLEFSQLRFENQLKKKFTFFILLSLIIQHLIGSSPYTLLAA